MKREKLIIFVKAPRAGFVKSRLADAIGQVEAARAYRTMVETLLSNLSGTAEVELCYSPDDSFTEIKPWLQLHWTAHPQGGGDLGTRMNRAFERSLSQCSGPTVLIGSDCPTITVADIEAAWVSLRTHDLVLGPATDGGYWLIGLRRPYPVLFEDMSWSTCAVASETLGRAKLHGLTHTLLSERTDIDTEKDWKEFLRGHAIGDAPPRPGAETGD